jgi:HAMP domain-containing protein
MAPDMLLLVLFAALTAVAAICVLQMVRMLLRQQQRLAELKRSHDNAMAQLSKAQSSGRRKKWPYSGGGWR